MSAPHCRSPQSCSVCLATPFQRVEVRDGVTYVDGVPVRASEPEPLNQDYARRGQRRGRGKR